MLCDLVSVAGVTEEQLQEHSFLVTNVEDRKKFASQKKTLLDTYNRVIREQIMSYQKRLSLVPSTIISTVKHSKTALSRRILQGPTAFQSKFFSKTIRPNTTWQDQRL